MKYIIILLLLSGCSSKATFKMTVTDDNGKKTVSECECPSTNNSVLNSVLMALM